MEHDIEIPEDKDCSFNNQNDQNTSDIVTNLDNLQIKTVAPEESSSTFKRPLTMKDRLAIFNKPFASSTIVEKKEGASKSFHSAKVAQLAASLNGNCVSKADNDDSTTEGGDFVVKGRSESLAIRSEMLRRQLEMVNKRKVSPVELEKVEEIITKPQLPKRSKMKKVQFD